MELCDGADPDPGAVRALALTNLGCFTTMRVTAGAVRGLRLHLARLTRDVRTVFDVDLDSDRVRALVRAAVADEPADVVVRVTVFDPALGVERPGGDAAPRVLVSPRPAARTASAPIRVRSTLFQREHADVKHTGLFAALHERRRAQRAGFDDAIFVDGAGAVSEGPTWSAAFWDGSRLVWPDAPVLPGVTRALLDEALGDASAAAPVRLEDLPALEAAVAVNAGVGVRAISSVDDISWPPAVGLVERLRSAYASIAPEPL